jgi:hypothetical protein
MLPDETTINHRAPNPTLTEIMHLVDMETGASGVGWNPETARLFAIDTAVTVIRRNFDKIPDADRLTIIGRLGEARTLVVAGRDEELGFLQAGLEANLGLTPPGSLRSLWLLAIDALIPSPYRAALIVTRSVLGLGAVPGPDDLTGLLRDRLSARLGEGELLPRPPGHLHLIA